MAFWAFLSASVFFGSVSYIFAQFIKFCKDCKEGKYADFFENFLK